ncbi:MAG: hypothetical protein ABSB82_00070 [Terriglobia bacterium]
MKTIRYCLALAAMAVFASAAFAQDPAPAQEPTLTSAEVKFDTTTDKKNGDTTLDVYIKTSDGQEVAKSEGNQGRWNKTSSHTVSLKIESSPTKTDAANGSVTLTIHPHGANKWEFNYKVTLKFSDDSIVTKELGGCVLTQRDPTRTDSLK